MLIKNLEKHYNILFIILFNFIFASSVSKAAEAAEAAEAGEELSACQADPRFSEFDFWLGEWEVHSADGRYVGSNVIAKLERGCVIVERWTGAAGGTGQSINYFDLEHAQWTQIWGAADGTQISIRGGLTEQGMRLTGKIRSLDSPAAADFRGLWTKLDAGRVRQFFEQSNDGGKTWTPWFEGFYTLRMNEK